MTDSAPEEERQLWLELPPISATAPRRLIVFLHAAGSTPELLAPVAIAFQLKFPGATVVLLQGLRDAAVGDARREWFDAAATDREADIDQAVDQVAQRLHAVQQAASVAPRDTVLVGFSQGATVALELLRRHPGAASILIGYAARLARPLRDGERLAATVHLIHGEHDSIVPLAHARRAFRGLQALGIQATLDVVAGVAHGIDQDLVNLGTWRLMRTLFRGRARRVPPVLH